MIGGFKPQPKLYKVVELLGQGTSALVFRGVYQDEGKEVPIAIKMINLDFSQSNIVQLQQETKIQLFCQHKNICPLYQSIIHKQFVLLVMPLLQVTPVQLMRTLHPNGFDEQIIATIMYDVLQGLQYIHDHSFIHRDLKLGNMLLNEEGETLLADFGVSCMIQPFSNGVRSTFVGSPLYMAPEVANNQQYNNKCDIWSFGMCMYQMATGKLPGENQDAFVALLQIIQADAPRLPQKAGYSKQLNEVVSACLQKDPGSRKSVQELLQMKFWAKRAPKDKIKAMMDEYHEARKGKKVKTYKDKIDQANLILQQDDEEPEENEGNGPWKFGNIDSEGSTGEVSCAGPRECSVEMKSPSSTHSRMPTEIQDYKGSKGGNVCENQDKKLNLHSSSDGDIQITQLQSKNNYPKRKSEGNVHKIPQMSMQLGQKQITNNENENREQCRSPLLDRQNSKSTSKLQRLEQKPQEVHNENFHPFSLRKTQSESKFKNTVETSDTEHKIDTDVETEINYQAILTEISDLWEVLQALRVENMSLKEQNEKYKQKLKLFMQDDQKK